MRRAVLILATIALLLPPTVLLAQSPSPEVKKTAKADQSAKPSGDGTGQTMKDSWITTKTKLALTTDGRTKARHVSVETQGATVMLRGKVSSTEERAAAEEIARGISGVTSVYNALQIVPDDQRKAASIKIRSDNSVVTLRGKVADPKAKSRASDVVRGVPGVKSVRNELAL